MRARRRLRGFLGRHLIPQRIDWIQVQGGSAKGLWLKVDLSSERGWWLGKHSRQYRRRFSKLWGRTRLCTMSGRTLVSMLCLPLA